ncbi:hypothetical protein KIN20_010543 [Parelaphostrongylus tenuis]|uniref:Uncharacterized protein n=1 Tax=Parelaphostrongylus tenuis TaxID=148309 RepID=A0AAD5QLF8_PARTN|nr:hypothetical protein KIN20_010543 [Parelaphostrongylus tenuis]
MTAEFHGRGDNVQIFLEIEKECDVELQRKGFSAMQRARLADLFHRDGREHILRTPQHLKRPKTKVHHENTVDKCLLKTCSKF